MKNPCGLCDLRLDHRGQALR